MIFFRSWLCLYINILQRGCFFHQQIHLSSNSCDTENCGIFVKELPRHSEFLLYSNHLERYFIMNKQPDPNFIMSRKNKFAFFLCYLTTYQYTVLVQRILSVKSTKLFLLSFVCNLY